MKVNFLIAEEIRPEAQNKLTVLGLFAGDTIIINGERPEGVADDVPAGLERLAILATIIEAPAGLHKFKGKITEPSGSQYQPEFQFGEAITKNGFSHSVIIELKPFIVKQPGFFRLDFFVDEEIFPFTFEIREQLVR